MYCKYCGQHNANDQTYCQNCGGIIKLNTASLEKTSINETKAAFCRKCGTAVLDRYCIECGTLGYNLMLTHETKSKAVDMSDAIDGLKSKLQDSPIADIKSVDDVKNLVTSVPIFKSSLISSLKILGIGLLISLVLFFAFTRIEPVQEIIYEIEDAANYGYPEVSKLKPNFIDMFNLSLQSPINISANIKGNDYGEKISIGANMILSFKLLILLLIPIIAVVVGQLKLFKDKKTSKESLLEYGLTSLIFSIFVKIIAVVSQKSIKINDPYDYMNLKLRLGFHDLWSIISVFLIIFALHVIISMIIKKDNPFEALNIKQYPDLGNRIKTYITSMGIFTAIVSAAMILLTIIFAFKEGAEVKDVLIIMLLVLPYAFIHTWLFSFGNNMSVTFKGVKGIEPVTMNFWKTFKGVKELKYYSDSAIWGYVFLIIVFIGLIYVIYRVVKDIEKEDYFKKLGFIAGAISIINIILSYLASFGVRISGKGDGRYGIGDMLYELDLDFLRYISNSGAFKQSYTIFSIIIVTFIWVFAIGAIIYFFRENHIYYKVKSFIEVHITKLMLGYTALILVSFYLLQTKLFEDIIEVLIYSIFPLARFL